MPGPQLSQEFGMFDTKVAIIVRDDLAGCQRMNVTAFLATGIAAAAPDMLGQL